MSVIVCKSNILFIIILTLKTRRNFLQRTRNRKKVCIYIVVCHRNRHSSNSSAWTKHDIAPNSHDCATCRYCYIRRETVRLASTWELFNLSLYYIYHPQTKFAKVMSVCLSTVGMVVSQYALQVVSQHALQVSGGGLQAHTPGGSWGVWLGSLQAYTQGGSLQTHTQGISRPTPRGESPGPHPGGVYPSMHWGRHPLPWMATAAGSTHPTGMLSCLQQQW